jgi:hypothetical protein
MIASDFSVITGAYLINALPLTLFRLNRVQEHLFKDLEARQI